MYGVKSTFHFQISEEVQLVLAALSFMASFETTINFVIVAVLLIPTSNAQLQTIIGTIQESCNENNDNYAPNSTYLTNLNLLTSSLSINGSINGYADGIVGTAPDRVYGLVLCRGDTNSTTCRTCLDAIRKEVLERCPLKKDVTIWYDYCLIRYSNEKFPSIDSGWSRRYLKNSENINSEEWPRFNQSLVNLLDKLIQYAAYNTSALPPLRFATGEMKFNGEYPIIYGLVQCTRNLSPDACNQCLKEKIGHLIACCFQSRGGRVLEQSCNFRYETGTFFSGSPRIQLQAIGAMPPVPSPFLPPPQLPSPMANSNDTIRDRKKKKTAVMILAIAVPTGITLCLLFFCLVCHLRNGIIKKRLKIMNCQPIASPELLVFDLQTVRTATNGFSEPNKLGEGGFGAVYKGTLEDGREIAVKRLSVRSSQGMNEFKNEVVLLAKLQHRNLVRLVGVCMEEQEKLLIYEYVQNRSLDIVLFDPRKKEQLTWERRRSIIEGISRGMLYLHEESQVKIIHRDLKASNILLDAKMNPKISDFGLAKLFYGDQTHASTKHVVGTFGYMSPEYAIRGHLSDKSDMFSFGVLILEIVTGRKNSDFVGSENSTNLLSHVWEHWSSGRVEDIVDPSLAGNYPHAEALRYIQIGLLCVQNSPSERPIMSAVTLMLSSYSISVCTPSWPGFVSGYSIGRSIAGGGRSGEVSQETSSQSTPKSPNEVSITDLDAR